MYKADLTGKSYRSWWSVLVWVFRLQQSRFFVTFSSHRTTQTSRKAIHISSAISRQRLPPTHSKSRKGYYLPQGFSEANRSLISFQIKEMMQMRILSCMEEWQSRSMNPTWLQFPSFWFYNYWMESISFQLLPWWKIKTSLLVLHISHFSKF